MELVTSALLIYHNNIHIDIGDSMVIYIYTYNLYIYILIYWGLKWNISEILMEYWWFTLRDFDSLLWKKSLFMDVLRIKKDGDFSIANC